MIAHAEMDPTALDNEIMSIYLIGQLNFKMSSLEWIMQC